MRVLSWNLNHRAAQRRVPSWIADAVALQHVDVAVFTEYVAGTDHDRFVGELSSIGLTHVAKTERAGRENEVLIAAREPMVAGATQVPRIHPSVPSNVQHVRLPSSGTDVLGFRMPAFEGADRPRKRETWDWLRGAVEPLRAGHAIVIGDFNTQPGDPASTCGDCLAAMQDDGWQSAIPAEGHSWKSPRGTKGRQLDYALVSPSLRVESVSYSWEFTKLAPEAAAMRVGLPDHAMLVVQADPTGMPGARQDGRAPGQMD